jgi:sporulation protein YqfC
MKHQELKKTGVKARPSLADLFPSGEMIVLYGNKRMTVRGCKKILTYTPREIRLRLKHRCLFVRGEMLICTSFSGGCTTLQGTIQSVGYDTEEGETP